ISALICFLAKDVQFVNAWVVMIIIARELIVTGIRLIALGERKVIAASMWGKLKTVSQFVMIIAVMINCIVDTYRATPGGVGNLIVLILVIITVLLTVFSGMDYVWKNKKLIKFN
ncbi:MAG: CDP-alcohol phosphatidyltransferase family protein, partial [Oscillospiraceae bacterium]